MLYLIGVVGLAFLAMFVGLKYDQSKIDSLTAQKAQAVAANASLKASCDAAIKQYQDAQKQWVTINKDAPKRAAAVKKATQTPDKAAAGLQAAITKPETDNAKQCAAAATILHDLGSLPN